MPKKKVNGLSIPRASNVHGFRLSGTNEIGGVFSFGEGNTLPNRMLLYVQSSGTATACVAKIRKYTYGKGLADAMAKNKRINKNQTANKLIKDVAQDLAIFQAFALLIKRNIGGEAVVIEKVPFELLRKRKKGGFRYSEQFTGIRGSTTSIDLPEYKHHRQSGELIEIMNTQINDYGKYYGEIFYAWNPQPGQYVYPLPEWFSEVEGVQADSSLSSLDLEALENGFMPSAIITTKGLEGGRDDFQEDVKGKTEVEEFQDVFKDFMGIGNRMGAMYFNFPNEDQSISVEPFDSSPSFKAMESVDNRIPKRVARAFGVPPAMVGLDEPGKLGQNQERKNAIKEFEEDVLENQNYITDVLTSIMPGVNWTIEPREI